MAKSKKARPMPAKKPMSFSQQDVELASKVKRANQRLRELEKQGLENSPAYKAVERIAELGDYRTGTIKSGEIKFSTNIRSLTPQQRRQLELDVDKFLSAETSTTKGAKAVAKRAREGYKKSAKGQKGTSSDTTFSQVNLDDIPDEELNEWLNLWGTAAAAQTKMLYGSDFTEFLINNLIKSELDYEESEAFLTDHYGEPLTEIMDEIDGVWEDAGGQPWDWSDIFGEE